jgi:dCTP deaminase
MLSQNEHDSSASLNMAEPRDGLLPAQSLRALIAAGQISAATPIASAQVQPASLDLRLGPTAYRVRASFLPNARMSVEAKLSLFAMHEIDLSSGAVLETGCVYVVPLQERLALPSGISAAANPKSSTGRLDVFTRIITSQGPAFDQIPAGYEGLLYAEICPQTFPVLVRAGSLLAQIRFRQGSPARTKSVLLQLLTRGATAKRKGQTQKWCVGSRQELLIDCTRAANAGLMS